jgi:hypothetical protein
MDLTEGFETSAKLHLTPGKYPKENIQDSKHGENLKSRMCSACFFVYLFVVNFTALSITQAILPIDIICEY